MPYKISNDAPGRRDAQSENHCQKEKEQSRQSRVADRKVEECQGEREGIRTGVWRGKGGLHSERKQVSRRRRKSKKSLPRKSRRRKHERVSGRKCSPGPSAESWFHCKYGQT